MKLTRDRVVPIISASVSWLILAITGPGPFLAEISQKQEQTGKALLARTEQLIYKVRLDADAPTKKLAANCASHSITACVRSVTCR